MLRLILLRHAKSSWDDARLDDFERPLAPRGLRNVPEMGRRLAQRRLPIDLVISSTAVRALATARGVAREIGYREDCIQQAPELYLASPDEILAVIRAVPAGIDTLMVVGHNPGLTELANRLDDIHIDNMPTAAMLCVEFNATAWGDINPAEAQLCWFDYPRKQPA
jgi:phosphohistidine phosphatase